MLSNHEHFLTTTFAKLPGSSHHLLLPHTFSSHLFSLAHSLTHFLKSLLSAYLLTFFSYHHHHDLNTLFPLISFCSFLETFSRTKMTKNPFLVIFSSSSSNSSRQRSSPVAAVSLCCLLSILLNACHLLAMHDSYRKYLWTNNNKRSAVFSFAFLF